VAGVPKLGGSGERQDRVDAWSWISAAGFAVVTGAGKGIGLAITRAFVDEGVHVVASARAGTKELSSLADTGKAQAVEVDLSTSTGPADLVVVALERAPVDILINNVGAVTHRMGGFTLTSGPGGRAICRSTPRCRRQRAVVLLTVS